MDTPEASYVLYLLEAMTEIKKANINKALLSSFTGYDANDILRLNDEAAVTLFQKYNSQWQEEGIYTAMISFIDDFNVRDVLLSTDAEGGERTITNLYQIIELLHKLQVNKKFSSLELISWLQRTIEGMETEGDEYQQRVESDEEAIKIVTIHKSKGLEYNIVFAPHLDFNIDTKLFKVLSFRDPATSEYISKEKGKLTNRRRWMV